MNFDSIIIFGIGAAGSNIVMNLARDLPIDVPITVVDYDKVEHRNVSAGTQAYSKSFIGHPKTRALQMLVRNETGRKIEVYDKELESIEDVHVVIDKCAKLRTLLIDCFDSNPSRTLLFNGAKYATGFEVLHVGFSPKLTGEIVWNENYSVPTDYIGELADTDICTQQGVRSFIMTLTGLASSVILDYYREGKKTNIYFDRWLNFRRW